MRTLVGTAALLTVLTPPIHAADGGDSWRSDVVAAVIGAALTAILAAAGYVIKALVVETRKYRANQEVFHLLYAVLDRILKEAGSDWLTRWGLYYRQELARELARLGRDKRDLIGGDTFLDLVRLSGALRAFSFDRSNEDSTVYSVDELIHDTCVALQRIVPRAVRSPRRRKKELARIEKTRQLMITGVGAFVPVSEARSNVGVYWVLGGILVVAAVALLLLLLRRG